MEYVASVLAGPSGLKQPAALANFYADNTFLVPAVPVHSLADHWLIYVSPFGPGHDFFETRSV